MNQKERMKKEYPYTGISDKNYLKDRESLFKKNGNGWWWGKDKEISQVEELTDDRASKGEING